MKIVIAIDSFKGSLTSMQAGTAVQEGIRRIFPNAEIFLCPIGDGGEGTTEALVSGLHGIYKTIEVSDPIGRRISAKYGILPNQTAVIEMASASGLTLLSEFERNPMYTTTYGFGELIKDAVQNGCRNFILGIGGSATNDGGIGCLQALGFAMLNRNHEPVSYGAKGVAELAFISEKYAIPELKECEFHVACDVKNPLCGESGCSAVFAPQKGATPEMIPVMDNALKKFAEITKQYHPDSDADFAGAGAAGGLGFGLMAYLNASLESGIDLIIKETALEQQIQNADIVITGEGCLDAQTAMGKAPAGIAQTARKYQKPVIAFSGVIGKNAEYCHYAGIDAYFPILKNLCSPEETMQYENAYQNLADTAEQVFRCISAVNLSGFFRK